jgi:hypothetical protein
MCNCNSELNAKLAEHNAAIVTTMFSTPTRVCIETYKVDDKKRGFRPPPKVLASYCPFCGGHYGPEAEGLPSSSRGVG